MGAAGGLGPVAARDEWTVCHADGRKIEERSEVKSQASAPGMIAAGGIDQQDLGAGRETADRGFE